MDEKLLPYFENANDGTAQAEFLEVFGSEKVQGGICLNFVIAWIHFYKQNINKAPNLVWNEMKVDTTLKQIAQNQEAYLESGKTEIGQLSVIDCLKLYGLNNQTIVNFGIVSDLYGFIPACLKHSKTLLIVIYLANKSGKIVGAHAIGVIGHNDKAYMYDPNEGVLSAPLTNLTELLGKIQYIYEEKCNYRVCGRDIYVV